MIRSMLTAFTLLIANGTQAQHSEILSKPVTCGDRDQLINNLESLYNEKLESVHVSNLFDTSTQIAMYKNDQTGTWTLIEYSLDPVFENLACILGLGKIQGL